MSSATHYTEPHPLKVLLLHGYTQSGPLFSAKSRALHKALQRSFSPRPVHFSYPSGPLRLSPSDVFGSDPPDQINEEDIDAHGWWRRKDTNEGVVVYDGIDDGMAVVAKCIKEEGPFDGVIGFSQGAAAAAMVASLLEGQRRVEAFDKAEKEGGIPYPASFNSDGGFVQQPLKFAVAYSGFCAPRQYKGFYEPKIETPVLHFLGQMDAIVEEERSRLLVGSCEAGDKNVVTHPGGHFLPSQRPWLDACVGFIRNCVEEPIDLEKPKEESVEDMNVPF